MLPSAKSLLLDLLSTVNRGSCPVRALIEAADLFGIGENSLRVALARLRNVGLVERDERGHYRLAGSARAIQARVSAWRRHPEGLSDWAGGWVGVHMGGLRRTDRRAVRRRTRALRLLGFRSPLSGLEVRPDNLAGGVPMVRAQLHSLGLEASAPVLVLSEIEPASVERWVDLWDTAELRRSYRASREELERSARRLPSLDRARARVESFMVGGKAIRTLALDPLLPNALLPSSEREALIEALSVYDRLGRDCWAGWLGLDAPSPPPADVGALHLSLTKSIPEVPA